MLSTGAGLLKRRVTTLFTAVQVLKKPVTSALYRSIQKIDTSIAVGKLIWHKNSIFLVQKALSDPKIWHPSDVLHMEKWY